MSSNIHGLNFNYYKWFNFKLFSLIELLSIVFLENKVLSFTKKINCTTKTYNSPTLVASE